MDPEEFQDVKEDTLEVFEDDVIQTIEYHEVLRTGAPTGSTINNDFGYVDEHDTPDDPDVPKTDVTDLLFSSRYSAPNAALRKLLQASAQDEFTVDYDIIIYIPTADIDRKNVTLKRDSSFLRMADGSEWRIEAIHLVPRMYGSSIITKLFCKKRRPVEDNAGKD